MIIILRRLVIYTQILFHTHKKSILGYIFVLVEGVISYRSTKQIIIASFSIEATFFSCYEAMTHAIQLRNLISGLKLIESIQKLAKIYCDNLTVFFFSKNNKSMSQNMHDNNLLILREKMKKHKVIIQHISTKLMVVVLMTKTLLIKHYIDHVSLANPFDIWLYFF